MKLNIFLLLIGLLGSACERHSASTLPGHGPHGANGANGANGSKPEAHPPAKQEAKPAPAPANAPAPKFFEDSAKK
jgi:hypothetical protein